MASNSKVTKAKRAIRDEKMRKRRFRKEKRKDRRRKAEGFVKV